MDENRKRKGERPSTSGWIQISASAPFMYSGQAVTLSDAPLFLPIKTELNVDSRRNVYPVLRAQQAESMLVILTTMLDIVTCCLLNCTK